MFWFRITLLSNRKTKWIRKHLLTRLYFTLVFRQLAVDPKGTAKAEPKDEAKGQAKGNQTSGAGAADFQTNVAYEMCNPASADYFKDIKINLEPYPVKVKTGNKIVVNFAVELLKQIEEGAKVSVEIKKNVFGFNANVPCVDVSLLVILVNVPLFNLIYCVSIRKRNGILVF